MQLRRQDQAQGGGEPCQKAAPLQNTACWDNEAPRQLGIAVSLRGKDRLICAPQHCSHLLRTNPGLSLFWPRETQKFHRLLKGFISSFQELGSAHVLSQRCPEQLLPRAQAAGRAARISSLREVQSQTPRIPLPLPPRASVSQLENPFGEQSKNHTSLTAALRRGLEEGKQEFLLSP